MCVIDQKTYVHESGREDIVEKRHYCHQAVGRTLCRHIERRELGVVRTVERRPSLSRYIASEPVITTTVSRDSRDRKYYPFGSLSRRSSKRTSSSQASITSTASPVDSAASLSSAVPPVYKQVRPEAPMPPPTQKTYPSARQMTPMSPTAPPDPSRTVRPDGTASYDRPPSLEMPRALFNERTPVARQRSWSSTNADIDDPEILPPRSSSRRVSFKERRPSISIDVDAATYGYISGEERSSPSLSQLPRISTSNKGKGRARVDSVRDEKEQARREQARLSGTDRRQRARQSRGAEEAARKRAESLQREKEASSRERERRERKRREAQDALEGRQEAPRSDTMQRRIDAEMAQITREQQEAEQRRREEALRSSPTSVRSYSYSPSSPTLTNKLPLSARRPPMPVAVHNYRDPLAERGAAVIDRYARASAEQQISDAMAYMELEDSRAAQQEDEMEAEPRLGRRTSERRPRRRDRRERGKGGDYYQ